MQEVEKTKRDGYALSLEEFREGVRVRAITSPVTEGAGLRGLLRTIRLSSSLNDDVLPSVDRSSRGCGEAHE